MTEAATGFLGRWARRKNDALRGQPVSEPTPPAPVPTAVPVTGLADVDAPVPVAASAAEPPPALSLDDVKLLTKDSDFKPFMGQNVGPEVRNAAMKKLFEDPHFNIMDGLDIYIDDYSISEPIPESMLRQMASAKFLGLFDDEEEDQENSQVTRSNTPHDGVAPTSETPDANATQSVAKSSLTEPVQPAPDSAVPGIDSPSQPEVAATFVASQENHADPYLRLQPDHAPSAPEAGGVT